MGGPRPRLLLIAPTVAHYIGGTETVVAELARRLARRADLTIVSGRVAGEPALPALPFEHRLVTLPFAGRSTRLNRTLVRWLRMNPFRIESRSFFAALAREGPDPAAFDGILTFYEMDAWLLVRRHPAVRPRALHLLPGISRRRRLRGIDPQRVLFLGHRAGERARRKWGIEVPALPLGVDPAFFPPAPRTRPESRRLVFVGRLDGSKRVDWLAALFADSDLARRGYTLEIIGDGPLGPELAARHRDTPGLLLSGRLTREQVVPRLQAARLVLHPTELESFGLTILEAMAAGVPVITHDLPAIRAWAGDHPTYAALLDRRAWLDAIARFEDGTAWSDTVARNLAFARGFDWDAIAQRVLGTLLGRA
jgi:glycosyltransferase involved in cell wall biosynthesis